jgi:hypothetical protein
MSVLIVTAIRTIVSEINFSEIFNGPWSLLLRLEHFCRQMKQGLRVSVTGDIRRAHSNYSKAWTAARALTSSAVKSPQINHRSFILRCNRWQ